VINIPNFIIVALISGYLCYVFIPLVIKFCHNYKLYDQPGPRKIHKTPTPRLGGSALFIAYFMGILPGFLLVPDLVKDNLITLLGIFVSSFMIFLLGVVDDLKGLKPLLKLGWQIAACLVLIGFGVKLEIINIPFYKVVETGLWGIPLTVIWLVTITNTINLIDGLDGLASGVSAIVAISFLTLSLILGLELPSLLAAGIIGISLAFLKYNYSPAVIFMGDSGSLFLGFMFAVISLFWPKSFATVVMLVPILALGVPIIEVVTTFFRRLLTGKKVYIADRKHIFHYLLDLGVPAKVTVWIFYFVSAQLALAAYLVVGGNLNIFIVLQFVFIIFVVLMISKNLKPGSNK